MKPKLKWVVLWSLWATRFVRQPTLPVRVSGGEVQGTIALDGSHVSYYGIPYATVTPEGRFQAPTPNPKWNGILDATEQGVRCSQRFGTNLIIGDEDCLTLNIYTPMGSFEPLPVMVFIHGGGFRDGSGSPTLYGPEYLVRHGVLLVTFNYRVEILGFLCLGIKEAPGNAGLKDQVEALKWVRENIAQFGGDPDSVTIFGESAGAASVLYHLISPISKGLFNKVVMQSGSAISPWAFQFEPLETASKLVKEMGYDTKDPHKIYQIFINTPADKLLSTRIPRSEGDVILSENVFVPCVEKYIPNVEKFLNDTPYNLIEKGQYYNVPMILGFNNAEGLMFVGKENDTTISKVDFRKALPRDLVFPNEEVKYKTADQLKKMYMGEEKISKQTIVKLARYEGDTGITYPVVATIDLLLRSIEQPLYGYKLSYDGWMNIAKMYFGLGKIPGATHADELFYMFKTNFLLPQAYFEAEFVDRLTTMWTNFAKYGDPTPETTPLLPTKWRAIDKRDPKLFVIDKHFSETPLWDDETLVFLNETYTKYRRKT